MHIGIDISRLGSREHTGTEHYTFALLGAMAKLDRLNPCTLYSNGLPASLPPLGTNMRLRSLPFPRLWTHTRLAGEMLHHPPDVLFVPAHVIPLVHPSASVVTIHDLGYLAFPRAHTPARWLDLHFSTFWSTRAASHIIAVSQATRNALQTHYRVPAEKITVIPHGVAPHFQPVTDPQAIAAAKKRYGIEGDYLLSIGTVQPRKNLVRLIDSFAQVVQTGMDSAPPLKDVRLVLAGKKGWLTRTIEQRGQAASLHGHLVFTGYVEYKDLPALLSGALALVFPSLYEGFGMPVLEAMACGTPVLTSTTTSLPEVAGDAALLVNPHDTAAIADDMRRVITEPELRETLRQRGLERASRFTWERCARETLRVLYGQTKNDNEGTMR